MKELDPIFIVIRFGWSTYLSVLDHHWGRQQVNRWRGAEFKI